MGIESLSVRDSVLTDVKTPDGVLADGSATWEVKTPQVLRGIDRAFYEARKQSPCLILWSENLYISERQALTILKRQLPTWGADYCEVIIVLGKGESCVHWIHD